MIHQNLFLKTLKSLGQGGTPAGLARSRALWVGAVLAVSACAEVQQSYTQSDGLTDETTSILPMDEVQTVEAQSAVRKSRFAKLEADDDDIPITGIKLATSPNPVDNGSQGGGLDSQNDPPVNSNIVAKNTASGNGGAAIVSQASAGSKLGSLRVGGGGITSQGKATPTSP